MTTSILCNTESTERKPHVYGFLPVRYLICRFVLSSSRDHTELTNHDKDAHLQCHRSFLDSWLYAHMCRSHINHVISRTIQTQDCDHQYDYRTTYRYISMITYPLKSIERYKNKTRTICKSCNNQLQICKFTSSYLPQTSPVIIPNVLSSRLDSHNTVSLHDNRPNTHINKLKLHILKLDL